MMILSFIADSHFFTLRHPEQHNQPLTRENSYR